MSEEKESEILHETLVFRKEIPIELQERGNLSMPGLK